MMHSFDRNNLAVYLNQYKATMSGEYGTMRNCTDYKNTDMVACDMCVKSFKWVGQVVRMFDNKIQKHIVE
jgi:hypothetical protein